MLSVSPQKWDKNRLMSVVDSSGVVYRIKAGSRRKPDSLHAVNYAASKPICYDVAGIADTDEDFPMAGYRPAYGVSRC